MHDFQLVYEIAHEKQSEWSASYIKKKLFSLTSRNVSNMIGQSNEAISIFLYRDTFSGKTSIDFFDRLHYWWVKQIAGNSGTPFSKVIRKSPYCFAGKTTNINSVLIHFDRISL